MIIVEGPDNAGKTTLISRLLADDPTLRLLHRERFKPGQETIASSYIKALVPGDGDRVQHSHAVADRLMASECIYGELFRKGCRMTPSEHLTIQLMLMSYNAMVVFCDPGDEAIQASWQQREQLYDSPVPIAQAYRARLLTIFPHLPVINYDWQTDDRGAWHARLHQLHAQRQALVRRAVGWWSIVPHGIGNLVDPQIVLIGDVSSAVQPPITPFMSVDGGDDLAQALITLNYSPQQMYWTTAIKNTRADHSVLQDELMRFVRPTTRVISFGSEAHAAYCSVMQHHGVSPARYTNLPHPRRLKDDVELSQEYTRLLAQALTFTPE